MTLEVVRSPGEGDGYGLTQISMSCHAGTHLDAPSHLFQGGAQSHDTPIDVLIGPAHIVDVTGVNPLTESECESADIPPDAQRVAFKTGDAGSWMDPNAARWLVKRQVTMVGWDGLSVDPTSSPDLPAHRTLLANGVQLVENLDLSQAPSGIHFMVCLPLKLVGADASPVRAALIDWTA